MCFCSTFGSTFSRFPESVGRRSDDAVASSLCPRKLRNSRFVEPSPAPSENTPDDATIVFRDDLLPGPLAFPRSETEPPLPRPRPRVFTIDVSRDVFTSLYQNKTNRIHFKFYLIFTFQMLRKIETKHTYTFLFRVTFKFGVHTGFLLF